MSYAPATLLKARDYVHEQTALPLNALGIVGDKAHGNEGYHVGWDRLKFGLGSADYSMSQSPRDRTATDAAMAFDIGNFVGLYPFSKWLVAQCQANTVDTRDIREVIYTPDGVRVLRWDRLGINSGGDDSHLFHTHISYFRDSEQRDKTAVFRRYFEGTPLPADEDDMPYFETYVAPVGKDVSDSYPTPPINSGGNPWGDGTLGIGADQFGGKAQFEVVALDGAGTALAWPDGAPAARLITVANAATDFKALPKWTRLLRITRRAIDANDKCTSLIKVSVEVGLRAV